MQGTSLGFTPRCPCVAWAVSCRPHAGEAPRALFQPVMLDSWWTERLWDIFFPSTLIFPCHHHSCESVYCALEECSGT